VLAPRSLYRSTLARTAAFGRRKKS